MISSAYFLTYYPDFSDLERHMIEYALKCATVFTSNWQEPQREMGTMLVAAHLLTMRWFQTAEIAGAAASVAQGGGSVGAAEGMDDFLKTHYGRMYVQLRDNQFVPGTLAI